jgi:hypothetical protein
MRFYYRLERKGRNGVFLSGRLKPGSLAEKVDELGLVSFVDYDSGFFSTAR